MLATLQQEGKQCRNDAHNAYLLRHKARPEGRRRKPVIEDRPRTGNQRRQQRDHNAVDVVDGQNAHQPILPGDAVPVAQRLGIEQQVGLREHHPLWRAGRAGGIDNQGFALRGAIRLHIASAGKAGPPPSALKFEDSPHRRNLTRQFVGFGQVIIQREQQPGFGVFDNEAPAPGVFGHVDRRHTCAKRPDGEIRHNGFTVIVGQRGHPVARRNTVRPQCGDAYLDGFPQLRVAQRRTLPFSIVGNQRRCRRLLTGPGL